MLLVPTYLAPSSIEGIGLFAKEFIKKGTPIWQFFPAFDQTYTSDQIALLSPASKEQFLKYAYLSSRTARYVLCFDDVRFFNHSPTPNVADSLIYVNNLDEGTDIALFDIQAGQELTYDYSTFENNFHFPPKTDILSDNNNSF